METETQETPEVVPVTTAKRVRAVQPEAEEVDADTKVSTETTNGGDDDVFGLNDANDEPPLTEEDTSAFYKSIGMDKDDAETIPPTEAAPAPQDVDSTPSKHLRDLQHMDLQDKRTREYSLKIYPAQIQSLKDIPLWPGHAQFMEAWEDESDTDTFDSGLRYQHTDRSTGMHTVGTPLFFLCSDVYAHESLEKFVSIVSTIDPNIPSMSWPTSADSIVDCNIETLTPLFVAILKTNIKAVKLLCRMPNLNPNQGLDNPLGGTSISPISMMLELSAFEFTMDIINHPLFDPNVGQRNGSTSVTPFEKAAKIYLSVEHKGKKSALHNNIVMFLDVLTGLDNLFIHNPGPHGTLLERYGSHSDFLREKLAGVPFPQIKSIPEFPDIISWERE